MSPVSSWKRDSIERVAPEAVELGPGTDWRYRGEGGANLVVSVPGKKTVVRFAKSKYAGKDQDSKIGEIAYFANEVMRPMLGPHFVRPVRIGVVDEPDFQWVKRRAQPYRPACRTKKDINSHRVIVSHDCVFLADDYDAGTVGDTFSFEIKPKQGWHSLKATCSVDLCHRCLKQHAKLHRGEIDSISRYCPLDLFSGDPQRMKKAVFDLFEAPCNRFKAFKNGEMVYTDSVGSLDAVAAEMRPFLGDDDSKGGVLDRLAAMICSALTAPFDGKQEADIRVPATLVDMDVTSEAAASSSAAEVVVKRSSRSLCCDTRSAPLPRNSILQRLLTLQRHAEIGDHDAKELSDRLMNEIEDSEGLHQLVMWHPNTKLEQELSQAEIDDVVQLQRFLLSVTAKDVSLLITFREVARNRSSSAESGGPDTASLPTLTFESSPDGNSRRRRYRVMISTIDLDPKPVHRIPTWVMRKEEYLQAYFDSVDDDDEVDPGGGASSGTGIVEQLFSHFGGGAFR